jgi:hypothetical protein
MSDAWRWMPIAAEVDIFDGEVGGDQKLVAGGKLKDGAIVADTGNQGTARAAVGQSPDAVDQVSFSQGQSKLNYSEKNDLQGI